ncbi:MAG: Toxin 1 domain [Caulobacteraceae bacterium]|nr:Toxin 1 domain [Caulobacteraceae bacterium]
MIVVDSSALLEVLLQAPAAGLVEARLAAADRALHAPHLLDVEIAQVVRRLVAINQVGPARARTALTHLVELPITRYPHDALLTRIWELRANLTAYDAAYVALAESLDAPLLTRDQRLAAAPGNHANIILV